ncbi:MAG: hypothetical protein LRY54_01195 [Alphaproteobacteria bacterium]|nr:hypothetical protein [Alphaproteobacteria bacterium]
MTFTESSIQTSATSNSAVEKPATPEEQIMRDIETYLCTEIFRLVSSLPKTPYEKTAALAAHQLGEIEGLENIAIPSIN